MSTRSLIVRAAVLALGIAMVAASPAAAQRDRSFEITAFGGGYFGSNIYQGTGVPPNTSQITTVGVNSAGAYGVRAGFNASRQFGMEFSWSAADPSMSFSNSYISTSAPKGDLSVNNFDFDAMFNFGQQRVWGYFALGLGWSSFAPTLVSDGAPIPISTKSYFAGNTAIGMKLFLNPHWAARFDARYRWVNTGHTTGTGGVCYYYCYAYASTYYGASELSGGLTYVAFK